MNFIVMDACILLSRLLQHGDSPQDIVKALKSDRMSLVAGIAEALVRATR